MLTRVLDRERGRSRLLPPLGPGILVGLGVLRVVVRPHNCVIVREILEHRLLRTRVPPERVVAVPAVKAE